MEAAVDCGRVGLLLALAALAQGNRVVIIQSNPTRREVALPFEVAQAITTQDAREAYNFFEQAEVRAILNVRVNQLLSSSAWIVHPLEAGSSWLA